MCTRLPRQPEAELTADRPLKRGGRKRKTDHMNMFFTFCPFCGKKYEKEAA